VLVCDNLSTHTPAAALYEAFEPAEARRLAKRFEWHYTPKHGSWLAERGGDRAERASAAVPRPPHPRRAATLGREVVAWERDRNAAVVKVDWQFTTTTDARVKLKRLYPTVRLQ